MIAQCSLSYALRKFIDKTYHIDRIRALIEMSVTRRQILAGLGLTPCFLLDMRPAAAHLSAIGIARLAHDGSACSIAPQTAEGPFYIDEQLDRSDIAEGRSGLAMALDLNVVNNEGCAAIGGARVDVWHANAAGCYSGFQGQGDERLVSTVGETFLRGTQFTDAAGRVRFYSIYPGWYVGRTAHVHFKVIVGGKARCVGQIYFPEDLNRFVFTTVPPYRTRRRWRDTLNRNDRVLATSGKGRNVVAKVQLADDHLVASLTIGIDS
jgi:protocatechuate 3,4-dioxygenase beta subunit